MILVGIDSIEIDRIKKTIENPKFLRRYFGTNEIAQLKSRNFPPQSVAANFCAKEAFLKLLGKGIGKIELNKIELLRETSGKPYLKLNNVSEVENFSQFEISVSVTHTRTTATVVVIAEVN
ncbi:MAG: holo-ACP synthase [Clostridia bacterium]|nr:holo-ACP synthase [Clostridia bacterium]